eukprot:2477206-Amphidinium_carterae.1
MEESRKPRPQKNNLSNKGCKEKRSAWPNSSTNRQPWLSSTKEETCPSPQPRPKSPQQDTPQFEPPKLPDTVPRAGPPERGPPQLLQG